MRIALVTNLCTHYRRPLYEELRRRFDVELFFTSSGSEWYRPAGVDAPSQGLMNASGGSLAVLPALVRGGYDCIVASLTGRAIVPAVYLASRLRRTPLVLWVGIWSHPETPFHRLTRPLVRHLYRSADAVLAYGTHVAEFVATESRRHERIFVAPQAVDGERFRRAVPGSIVDQLRRTLALTDKPVVTFVGRLEPEKGLDVLLHASAASRASHMLLLVGTGSGEPSLRRLAGDLGIADRVRFAGWAGQAELPAYLRTSDLLVLPSVTTPRFKEPWGLVVNEAMCCSLPVIATDAVGAAAGGLVVDGVTGIVVPESSVASLAAALDRLCSDREQRVAMGLAGSELVSAYTFAAAADAFEEATTAAVARGRLAAEELACAS